MNITFVTNLYPPNQIGGYEELCWEVASRLVELGHDVSVLTSPHGGRVAHWPGQKVDQTLRLLIGKTIYDQFDGRADRRQAFINQNFNALENCVSAWKPDVIFCWNLYGLQTDVLEFLGKLGTPVVMMLTDNWLASMLNPDYVGRFFRDSVYGYTDERGYLRTKSNASIAVSPNISAIFGSNFMRRFYSASGIEFANNVVIHNGVSIPNISAERAPVPREGEEVKLLFASRLVEVKGAHLAVEALGILRTERPDKNWRLELVGDCSDENYVEKVLGTARNCNVSELVSLRGRVPVDELQECFRNNDIYLFPSLYEPFSLTLIHAMGAGIPTIASDVGGNTEIVSDGETGLLFKTKNARSLATSVLEFLDRPDQMAEARANGARRAREFSTDKMIEGMLKHLRTRAGLVDA